MWALCSTRLRRWLLLMVGLPILGRLLHRIADSVEARRGPASRSANFLRTGGDLARRRRRGRRRHR